MKSILSILKSTFIGGILFLIPLALIIFFFEKGYHILQKITIPLVSNLPKVKVLGMALEELIGLLIIIILCFLAGLLSKSRQAKSLVSKLENSILSLIPGYSFMKNMNENIMGIEKSEDLKVILARVDDGWQFAFLIEQIDEEHFTVFVPDAPSPWTGSIYFMEKERIKETKISQKEALVCIRKLGYGSSKLLKDVL
ncbi:DUF502 domain-containing protein [Flavobacterium hydatis]|uniref:DUF502 domain-containing protein n=1 Tax=Flavobacterium hydatis TaxID=991 RepID=A0A086AHW7_FLAHY|nr:DUF502 domain-containing protein [Flavobacterium hydatis]KFF16281.1 hypothetical protein IW20_10980 [Flavobacterium hydatis]OXA96698.1 hypothetical protein B0A62_05430 [Flavobacterium hydatis]